MNLDNLNLIINRDFYKDAGVISKTSKLVISNNKYTLLSSREIKGNMVSNIDSIAKSIAEYVEKESEKESNAIVKKFDVKQTKNLLKNVRWIDEKLESHNSKIKKSFLLSIYNFILKFFGSGLEYNRLTDTITKLKGFAETKAAEAEEIARKEAEERKKAEEIARKKAEETARKEAEEIARKKAEELAELDLILKQGQEQFQSKTSAPLYQIDQREFNAFFTKLQEKGIKDFDSLSKVLTRIDTPQGIQIFQKIQDDPILQDALIRFISSSPLLAGELNLGNLIKALTSFKSHTEDFKKEPNFLITLYFIEQQGQSLGHYSMVSKGNSALKKYRNFKLQNKTITLVFQEKTKQIVRVESELGEGSFKAVKKVLDFETRKIITVGRQELATDEDKEMAEKEFDLMNRCKGIPYVLEAISGKIKTKKNAQKKFVLVTPYCNNNDLEHNLDKLTKLEKIKVADQIFQGIMRIHKLGIIHRDLKPENIYLHRERDKNGKEELKVKVSDFGLSHTYESDERSLSQGSPFYMPPEILRNYGEKADYDTDAYALGIILSEIFQGKIAFLKNKNQEPRFDWQIIILVDEMQNKPAPIDESSIDFIIHKLTAKRGKRWTVNEAHQHFLKIQSGMINTV